MLILVVGTSPCPKHSVSSKQNSCRGVCSFSSPSFALIFLSCRRYDDEPSTGRGEGAHLKQRIVMESAWCSVNGDRPDLKTILEEEDKGCNKGLILRSNL